MAGERERERERNFCKKMTLFRLKYIQCIIIIVYFIS